LHKGGTFSDNEAMRFAVLLAALAACHARELSAGNLARQQALEKSFSEELDPETKVVKYKSPITRVINMLQKMKAELEKEAAKESEMYDKMVCWCETSEKEKTKAVKDAEAKDIDLSSQIESRSARFGELSVEIATLKKQIAKDTETLKQATAIREKETGAFRGEEKDMVQAVTNLKNAIAVLSRHQSSFIQADGSLRSGIAALLNDLALKHELLLAARDTSRAGTRTEPVLLSVDGTKSSAQAMLNQALPDLTLNTAATLPVEIAQQVVAKAAGASQGTFLQQPGMYKSYNTRSSRIFGILNQMLEDFESQLSDAQKAEIKAQADYVELARSKEAQIAKGKERLDEMEMEHSANQKALSDAKEDLELTRKQRSEDVEFLRNLRLTCNDLDAQWAERSKTRSEETKAVAEAISILTDDDNKEALDKTISFIQEKRDSAAQTASERSVRAKAAAVLRRAAPLFDRDNADLISDWSALASVKLGRRSGLGSFTTPDDAHSRLSTLAMAMQLDSFTKVKEMMDKMVAELKDQQKDEAEFKEYCTSKLNENEKTTYVKTEEKEDLEAKIEGLETMIAQLQKEIEANQESITEAQTDIKRASETREKENAEFQTTISDQRATQNILKKALTRLRDFYKPAASALLLQRRARQTPPVQFTKYAKNSGASPVLGMIEQIVEESVQLEKEATSTEAAAQADYETLLKDSNDMINALAKAITKRKDSIAKARLDLADSSSNLDSTNGELESLAASKTDLHGQCDFVLKNFDVRQEARLQEIEAIQQAKAFLDGMKRNEGEAR